MCCILPVFEIVVTSDGRQNLLPQARRRTFQRRPTLAYTNDRLGKFCIVCAQTFNSARQLATYW